MTYKILNGTTLVNTIEASEAFCKAYCAAMGYTFEACVEVPQPEPEPQPTVEDLITENDLLKAQLQAQTERSDFIEDCIAELATKVYSTV